MRAAASHRVRLAAVLLVATALAAGCGGGGSDAGGATNSASSGGTSGTTASPGTSDPTPPSDGTIAAAPNVLAVAVDTGPAGAYTVNAPYVDVTICAPGSSTRCQTIDHVLVDTGSTGLRIMASALDPALSLPSQTDGRGNALAECTVFVDGTTWGAVRLADVRLGGETASGVAVQVIGDAAYPSIPSSCSSRGAPENTVAAFGANGILGAGTFLQDCGAACAQSAVTAAYYACSSAGCQSIAVPLSRQVGNPVASLPADNNGVVLQLPAVPSSGTTGVSGSLVLGVGTRTNNTPSNVVAFDLDSYGNLTTVYGGQSLGSSFVDSGSNALFFPDRSIPVCGSSSGAPGYYCPASTLARTATILGAHNGASASVAFDVANAAALFTGGASYAAFGNLAAPFAGSGFDWGLPFFYGRPVYFAIEQRTTPLGPGPLVAF